MRNAPPRYDFRRPCMGCCKMTARRATGSPLKMGEYLTSSRLLSRAQESFTELCKDDMSLRAASRHAATLHTPTTMILTPACQAAPRLASPAASRYDFEFRARALPRIASARDAPRTLKKPPFRATRHYISRRSRRARFSPGDTRRREALDARCTLSMNTPTIGGSLSVLMRWLPGRLRII